MTAATSTGAPSRTVVGQAPTIANDMTTRYPVTSADACSAEARRAGDGTVMAISSPAALPDGARWREGVVTGDPGTRAHIPAGRACHRDVSASGSAVLRAGGGADLLVVRDEVVALVQRLAHVAAHGV